MTIPTTLTCSYSVTAFGSLSAASLGARLDATPYQPLLPNAYGLLLISDSTATVGQVSTRTFVFLFNPGEGSASAHTTIVPGEVGAPISGMAVDSSGDDYAAQPLVDFSPRGSQRNGRAYAQMKVTSLAIVKGGRGFTSTPSLLLVGGGLASGGVRAQGRVNISGGVINSTIIDVSGGPYSETPIAVLVGGSGTGAYLQAALGVSGFRLPDPGNGWLAAPSVVLTPKYYSICGGGDFVAPMRSFMKGALEDALQTTVLAAEPVVS